MNGLGGPSLSAVKRRKQTVGRLAGRINRHRFQIGLFRRFIIACPFIDRSQIDPCHDIFGSKRPDFFEAFDSLDEFALLDKHIAEIAQPVGAVTRKLERVPITVLQSAADFRAFRVEPNTIDVTVRGPIAEVQALTPRQLEVFINLTDVHDSAGLTKKILVHSPPGIAVVEVSHTEARLLPANSD